MTVPLLNHDARMEPWDRRNRPRDLEDLISRLTDEELERSRSAFLDLHRRKWRKAKVTGKSAIIQDVVGGPLDGLKRVSGDDGWAKIFCWGFSIKYWGEFRASYHVDDDGIWRFHHYSTNAMFPD